MMHLLKKKEENSGIWGTEKYLQWRNYIISWVGREIDIFR